jgi:hypothetical protein
MDKDAQTDLFPWILGILLVAVAIPAVLAFTKPADRPIRVVATTVTPSQPGSPTAAASPATTANTPAPLTTPIAPAVSAPATRSITPAVAAGAQSAVRPALPVGQVWQCVVNGQKVFSDTACGDGATIRQLSDVNGMDPTPVARAPLYTGYGPYPGYGPNPDYGPNPGYAPTPGYAGAQDGSAADDVYGANQLVVIDGRRRHEHVAAPRTLAHTAARGHL